VRVAAEMQTGLSLIVADDGPGIPREQAEDVLKRGHRADQQQPGQGIGLAVVMDILNAYRGHLEIARSSHLGGAEMRLKLPAV
jgi:two-component system sensor histidine kinase PhoQ